MKTVGEPLTQRGTPHFILYLGEADVLKSFPIQETLIKGELTLAQGLLMNEGLVFG